nr:hypothetical protein [Tanacetum cinerariifolium]
EFWCTAIAYDPNPSTDENKPRPLKEFLIKFRVMNGKKPLTIHFNTFTTSTGFDYNNGAYVVHPSPKAVKAELAKIVLDGNYSSTEQVNSVQHLITYSLITGTKVDIGKIIYSDLVTKLLNKSTLRYVSYHIFIFSALEALFDTSKVTEIGLTVYMIAVNNQKDSVSPPSLSAKKKKWKSHIVTPTLSKSQGPEASGALSKKRKQPKSKKTHSETKVSSTKPTEGSEQSHSAFSGTVPDPQDIERNIQLATFDEGAAKTTSFPERPGGDKDSEGLKPPADMEPQTNPVADPSGTDAKYQANQNQLTRLRYRSLTKKGKTYFEVKPDIKALQLKTFADVQTLLLSDDEIVQESEEYEVFAAREDMDADTQMDTEAQSLPPNTDKHDAKAQHEEGVVSYADLEASIECYYKENIDHMEQTAKVIDATMNSLDKNNITRGDLLNALNRVTEALKAIQNAVKENPTLYKKMIEATEAYTKNYNDLLTLIKNFDFERLKITAIELSQATIKSEVSSLRQDTSDIKSIMTEIYQSFKGENVTQADTEEPRSHTEGEHAAMEEEPTNAVPITTVIPTEIPTPELTEEQIQAHMDKKEKIKKSAKEAKMLEMTKTEMIKVVQEVAKKIRLDLKTIISAKATEKFKKVHDAEHQVLKREHSQKAKRAIELRMKRVEQYMWTMLHDSKYLFRGSWLIKETKNKHCIF